jgi:hypothetical protein
VITSALCLLACEKFHEAGAGAIKNKFEKKIKDSFVIQ